MADAGNCVESALGVGSDGAASLPVLEAVASVSEQSAQSAQPELHSNRGSLPTGELHPLLKMSPLSCHVCWEGFHTHQAPFVLLSRQHL